ncbi:hypothetical protein Y10_26830 [Neptunitalea sp. Y10]|uniref:Uncharacterized protein n=1 Tax=Neptunitalea lumnitzerae TaxID=2965509 RepID=A0ABQ5MMJ1_9FLAO|nr:hypothetical protein Y10_26830 [Neptunitalea sp. Y10]
MLSEPTAKLIFNFFEANKTKLHLKYTASLWLTNQLIISNLHKKNEIKKQVTITITTC